MNAIEQLYINAGLVTEDGYVKVRDGLWVKSGPYERQSWNDADKSILPSKEELHEIYLKLQELIQIQECCGLDSLRQISEEKDPDNDVFTSLGTVLSCSWVGESLRYIYTKDMIKGNEYGSYTNSSPSWVIPIRRVNTSTTNSSAISSKESGKQLDNLQSTRQRTQTQS